MCTQGCLHALRCSNDFSTDVVNFQKVEQESPLALRSDEGLTLKTQAFEILYGGQFTLSTQLIKPNNLDASLQSFLQYSFQLNPRRAKKFMTRKCKWHVTTNFLDTLKIT